MESSFLFVQFIDLTRDLGSDRPFDELFARLKTYLAIAVPSINLPPALTAFGEASTAAPDMIDRLLIDEDVVEGER